MPIALIPGGFKSGSAILITAIPGSRGSIAGAMGYQRLAGESLYNVNLTLQNVVAGSVILITDLSNVEIIRATAVGGDTVLILPFYGSNQSVKVVVRKATVTPFYQSYDTQAVITSTGTSLYVSQLTDE